MFRRVISPAAQEPAPTDRITSVLGPGVIWKGDLRGSGGIRIEGNFEGEIVLRGMLVVGETGKVTCKNLVANSVIVAGMVKGDIKAEKLEIRSTGRVWGDVDVVSFSTEEGAFLRGQVTMEEKIELSLDQPANDASSASSNPKDGPVPMEGSGKSTPPEMESFTKPIKTKPEKTKKI
jgi:cytoskeletal protein CcmA (bactofilin family)